MVWFCIYYICPMACVLSSSYCA